MKAPQGSLRRRREETHRDTELGTVTVQRTRGHRDAGTRTTARRPAYRARSHHRLANAQLLEQAQVAPGTDATQDALVVRVPCAKGANEDCGHRDLLVASAKVGGDRLVLDELLVKGLGECSRRVLERTSDVDDERLFATHKDKVRA
ncbi:hypothetical protein MTO96_031437 [Rhipicephalus appendiculatus]